jgi:outer membrane protein OmpA-like peptidoglycan-associated protein
MAELNPRPVAAAPEPVRVLFDTGKSNLRPEAQQTIAGVAATVRGNPAARITVVGKTDTVGSSPYNLGLSKRRASAVQSALLSDGVSPDQVDANYTGEQQLNVPTPDHTPEQQNRAVDIQLH